ncbi:SMI1/KNR4 family protein [Streptomyces pactum]|uniref:SMI1/KNR4 family protein n=1 Tax=Streptomyces pactum TaxID=68249 RepID=UPI0036F730C5
MTELFEDDDSYTGPPLDEGLVRRAEEELGLRLPLSYVEVLRLRNGGVPRRRCCPTEFSTTWAPDHFEISAILGIGGPWGIIDHPPGASTSYSVTDWEYPEIGFVVCDTPSAGHDTVMLDYSACGPDGEPAVAYVDEDRVPRRVADSFAAFLTRLTDCRRFD